MKRLQSLALLLACFAAACAHQPAPSLDAFAHDYVRLALALGEHDADWVDAYYGPPELREEVKKEAKSVAAIHDDAVRLRDSVNATPISSDRMLALRRNYLIEQLGAL